MQTIATPFDPVKIEVRDGMLCLTLRNHHHIALPLEGPQWAWLREASAEQQADYHIYPASIIWESLDEGLDLEALFEGWLREIRSFYDPKPHLETPALEQN